MKIDQKLMKYILLALRDSDKPEDIWIDMTIKNYDPSLIHRHYKLLNERGYIDAIDASHLGGLNFIPQRLTSAGYDHLDVITQPFWKTVLKPCLSHTEKVIYIFIGAAITKLLDYLPVLFDKF